MRCAALATDFDGTLAHDGGVEQDTYDQLRRWREAGRKLLLVTGRLLPDAMRHLGGEVSLFDALVVENGALLYFPADRKEQLLASPPPAEFVDALRVRGVSPLEVGRAIVATRTPHEVHVLEVIRDQHLEMQVVFNKGAVMALPSGVNKATGLAAALSQLRLSPRNVVAVGDAENDHAFMRACEYAAAVANALPQVKQDADILLQCDHGAGVRELIDRVLTTDLSDVSLARHRIRIGESIDGADVTIDPQYPGTLIVAGDSGAGKTRVTIGILEQIVNHGYQACIIDPEGDYEALETVTVAGDANSPPLPERVISELGKDPAKSVAAILLGVPLQDRPRFVAELVPGLQALRANTGRPHWLVFDEAHHIFRKDADTLNLFANQQPGMFCVTTNPSLLSDEILMNATSAVVVGKDPRATLAGLSKATSPNDLPEDLGTEQVAYWNIRDGVTILKPVMPSQTLQRHRRKYAKGELAPEKSFYFRGKDAKLNLRASNLIMFSEIARGIDDETWLYHLRKGDYRHWFSEMLGDDELAAETQSIEDADAEASRAHILDEIDRRYTAPA